MGASLSSFDGTLVPLASYLEDWRPTTGGFTKEAISSVSNHIGLGIYALNGQRERYIFVTMDMRSPDKLSTEFHMDLVDAHLRTEFEERTLCLFGDFPLLNDFKVCSQIKAHLGLLSTGHYVDEVHYEGQKFRPLRDRSLDSKLPFEEGFAIGSSIKLIYMLSEDNKICLKKAKVDSFWPRPESLLRKLPLGKCAPLSSIIK